MDLSTTSYQYQIGLISDEHSGHTICEMSLEYSGQLGLDDTVCYLISVLENIEFTNGSQSNVTSPVKDLFTQTS